MSDLESPVESEEPQAGDPQEAEPAEADRPDADQRDAERSEEERPEPPSPEETAEIAEQFVTGLLSAMELEGEVAAGVEEGRATISITGEDLGILIGRRGQTLDALQEVARTAVQRRLRSRVRLLVDVEGYRARRKTSLQEYAVAMATRAIERGTEIELEPMSAYERKLCHDAVATVEGASSFSEGEEPNRKVVIRAEA